MALKVKAKERLIKVGKYADLQPEKKRNQLTYSTRSADFLI